MTRLAVGANRTGGKDRVWLRPHAQVVALRLRSGSDGLIYAKNKTYVLIMELLNIFF